MVPGMIPVPRSDAYAAMIPDRRCVPSVRSVGVGARAAAAALGIGPTSHGPDEQGGSGPRDGGAGDGPDASEPGGPPAQPGEPRPAGAPGGGGGPTEPRQVMAAYWRAMNANDWAGAAALFADGYVCRWPQSQELIRGGEAWTVVQANFPTPSPWRFTVVRDLAEGSTVVSEVTVANEESSWRCVQFAEVVAGRIVEQTEYWPEEMAAPTWRAGWTTRVPPSW